MTDATKLAESLRTMRSSARRHHDGVGEKDRWSVVLDAQWIGDLTDAADLIAQMAAEIKALKEAPAVLLTDEQVRECVDSSTHAGCQVRAAEAMSLRANGMLPAVLLSDADLVKSIDWLMDCGLVQKLRAVESAVLAANGKVVA